MAYPIEALKRINQESEESSISRAFEIIDELNTISSGLTDYTLSIREIDHTTYVDNSKTKGFSLSVSKHVPRPR